MITASDEVGDLLSRGREERILIAVNLNDVRMAERALPSGGLETGPADECGICSAKHFERALPRGIQ